MKKLIYSTLVSLVVPLAAHATGTPSLTEIQSKIEAQIRTEMAHQNLRTQGAYNPFHVLDNSGLMSVQVDDPVLDTEGGGQNGAFAAINKKTQSMEIDFSNTWVHGISRVYCLPSAVTVSGAGQSAYRALNDNKLEQCLEVAVVSRDMSLDGLSDQSGIQTLATGSVNYQTTPEYGAILAVKNGKLSLKTTNGLYQESIYIWNRNDYQTIAQKFSTAADNDAAPAVTPVAVLDQGKISRSELLNAFTDVEWLSNQVPSGQTNLAQARSALKLLSPENRAGGEQILSLIKKYQSLRAAQSAAAKEAGLNGSVALNTTYKKYDDEIEAVFPAIETVINGMIVKADKDPSIVTFLIAIQPGV